MGRYRVAPVRLGAALAGSACLLAAGCSASSTTGSPSHPASTSSASASSSVDSPDELTFEEARDLGLLRDDTVRVDAPAEVVAGDGPATVTVTVTLSIARPDNRIELDWSGDCVLPDSPTYIEIPAGAWRVTATGTVAVPTGRPDCFVQADSLFPERPYTGDGATITVRR